MVDFKDIKLIDLVPEGLRSDPEVVNICGAIQPEIDILNAKVDSVKVLTNIDEQTNEEALDHLAWHFGLSDAEGWGLASTFPRNDHW